MTSRVTPPPDTTWADLRGDSARRSPPAFERASNSRGLYLQRLRVAGNRHWQATLPDPENRRRTRYVTYALDDATRNVDEDFSTLRLSVEAAEGAVGFSVTDSQGTTDPSDRPGWSEACRLLQGGLVDGIAVMDRHVISPSDRCYESVVQWISRTPALLMLVRPEGEL